MKNRTHCKSGHELTPENTTIFIDGDYYECRVCMQCKREREKRRDRTGRKRYHLKGKCPVCGGPMLPKSRMCRRCKDARA